MPKFCAGGIHLSSSGGRSRPYAWLLDRRRSNKCGEKMYIVPGNRRTYQIICFTVASKPAANPTLFLSHTHTLMPILTLGSLVFTHDHMAVRGLPCSGREETHNRKTHLKGTQEPRTTLSSAAGLNERSCRTRHTLSTCVSVCVWRRE